MTSFPMTACMHTLDKLPLRQPIEHHILHQGKRKHQPKERTKKAETPMVSDGVCRGPRLINENNDVYMRFVCLRTTLAESQEELSETNQAS